MSFPGRVVHIMWFTFDRPESFLFLFNGAVFVSVRFFFVHVFGYVHDLYCNLGPCMAFILISNTGTSSSSRIARRSSSQP